MAKTWEQYRQRSLSDLIQVMSFKGYPITDTAIAQLTPFADAIADKRLELATRRAKLKAARPKNQKKNKTKKRMHDLHKSVRIRINGYEHKQHPDTSAPWPG